MQLIVTPFWGDMSDRIGRKPIFIIGLFGYGFSFVIYGIATQLWMLFAARMIGGVLSGSMYPASLAYIADITDSESSGISYSKNRGRWTYTIRYAVGGRPSSPPRS